jgi:hypothetical protein
VAFFFIVLFNLGLDLGAAVPGFFFTAAIRVPPLGSLLPDEHQNLVYLLAQMLRIIEICYVRIKYFAVKFRKKF